MDHPVVDLLKSLMGIVCTSGKEYDVGVFLETHLSNLGYTVERIPIAPGSDRHNVYAYLGPSRQTRVLVTAHMDTVPPHIPITVDVEQGMIRGRGSSDDLGPLAAQVVAVEELRREGLIRSDGGDVGLLFVVGEENGGHGMFAANDMGLVWESGVFAEPTENKLGKGHKGQIAFELTASGVACHSGYPHLGKSAITTLLTLLDELRDAPWGNSDVLGPSTFNIGKINGGEAHNIIPPSAKALCEVRMVADLPGVRARIAEIVSRHPDVELNFVFEYPEALLEWEIDGFEAAPVAFGTDIPRLNAELCGRRILYGPGSILVAHGPDEYIKVSELIDSIAAYKKLILRFLE